MFEGIPKSRSEAKASGFKYYFTGSPCKKGHLDKRYASSSACLTCARDKAFLRSKLDHVKEQNKKNKRKPEYKSKQKIYAKSKTKGLWSSQKQNIGLPAVHPDYHREYYKKNREKLLSKSKKYLNCPNKKETRRVYVREWQRNRNKTVDGIISSFMRKCIYRCLVNKKDRTEKQLGYKKQDLINHIESQFSDGMNWDNRGLWHIDHIVPISYFISQGVTDPKIINSLDNLRPLWAFENLSKGAKTEDDL